MHWHDGGGDAAAAVTDVDDVPHKLLAQKHIYIDIYMQRYIVT